MIETVVGAVSHIAPGAGQQQALMSGGSGGPGQGKRKDKKKGGGWGGGQGGGGQGGGTGGGGNKPAQTTGPPGTVGLWINFFFSMGMLIDKLPAKG